MEGTASLEGQSLCVNFHQSNAVFLRSSSCFGECCTLSSDLSRFLFAVVYCLAEWDTGIKAGNKPRRPSLVSFPLYEDDSTADKTLPPFSKPVKNEPKRASSRRKSPSPLTLRRVCSASKRKVIERQSFHSSFPRKFRFDGS